MKICEHRFEAEDPVHAGYSLTEVDLFPGVGPDGYSLSIRRNIEDELYEIFNFEHLPDPYRDDAVYYSNPDIHEVIEEANQLEEEYVGHSSFAYGHDRLHCPEEVVNEFEGLF